MLQIQLKTPRWKMILNFLRMCPYDQEFPNEMTVDNCKLVTIDSGKNESVKIVDKETGEILIVFGENGDLLICSDWGYADWQWDRYDVPLYDYEIKHIK